MRTEKVSDLIEFPLCEGFVDIRDGWRRFAKSVRYFRAIASVAGVV